ncbi:nucleolar protein 11 [Cimex lectularius]|uniref:Nucleolar protein 11 N-terminal domain-containing protein n=1 Tax=Cimex lectularius TaxID=79782 RepID=A0A8I6RJU8_CIMLE|nr:nucleolar protein 11 [Cimex lectularius]
MAKLLAPYSLCPLIEQRRFIGVNEDSCSGCVIVTLGKNIIIRYRLSDQKQVSCWSSKSKLSAPVIYDHFSKKYIGVFNYDQIAFWNHNLAELNKIRKFRFKWLIHSLLSNQSCPPIIVFCNGHVGILENEFKLRKNNERVEATCFKQEEKVKTAKLVSLNGEYYICIQSLTSQKSEKKLYFVPIEPDKGTRFSVDLDKDDKSALTFAIIEGKYPQLLTLWSDGTLKSEELPLKNEQGRVVANVSCINTNHPAAILPIDDHHIVLYGAAPNSEGAHLVILSLKFGLPEAIQKMKVYNMECRMWLCRDDILVICGSHLVVTSFRLGTTRLVSLLGVARDSAEKDKNTDEKEKMEIGEESTTDIVKSLKQEGKAEHFICNQIVPILLKRKDKEGMFELVNCIVDVPDQWIVEMILFSIEAQHLDLMERLLSIPLVGNELSLGLVRQHIKLETVLVLLNFISGKLSDGSGNKGLVNWASLLLDSHYQQYILSKDNNVINAVKSIKHSVDDYITCLDVMSDINAEINFFKKGHCASTPVSVVSHGYVYEKVRLY